MKWSNEKSDPAKILSIRSLAFAGGQSLHQFRVCTGIGLVHAELLFIHPFRDGNGRTMRILANLISYKQGYDKIDMEPVSKGGEMRERYIAGVQAAGQEDYEPMVQLIRELFPLN